MTVTPSAIRGTDNEGISWIDPFAGWIHRVTRQPWVVVSSAMSVALGFIAVRALAAGVQLIDERAIADIRSRDVLTENHPLVGWRSSGGDFNHPGPLQFDLLALPVRVLGGPVGVTLGVIAIHIAMLWISGVAARRFGGPDTALAVVGAFTILCWSMGSDVLIDPWPANFPVLPFFAFLVLTVAVIAGHDRFLPLAVAIGSLCFQTHLGYIVLVPVLVLVAGAVVTARWVRGRSRSSRRVLVTSGAVGCLAWLQPLWQEVVGPGDGNLGRVLSQGTGSGDYAGLRWATRAFTSILADPPAWWRPGYDDLETFGVLGSDGAVVATSRLLSTTRSVVVLAVLVGVLAWCHRFSARNQIRDSMLTVAAIASVAAILTLAILPIDPFGVSTHKFRFVWPVAAFVAATLATGVLRLARVLAPPVRWPSSVAAVAPARWSGAAFGTAVITFAAVTVLTRDPSEGSFTRRDVWPVAAELRSQLASFDEPEPVLIETERLPFADYFTWVVMAELNRHDIEFVVDSPAAILQVGDRRHDDGAAATTLFLVYGDWATFNFDDSRRVAYARSEHESLEVGVFVAPSVTATSPQGADTRHMTG